MKPCAVVLVLSAALVPVAGAHATSPACEAPIGQAVAMTAAPLSVEDAGGRYDTGTGRPDPGEKRVGALRYEWGFMLQTDDPRLAHIVLATLPYRLTNITTLPAPDSPWTGITVTGAGLREPGPYLKLAWWTTAPETYYD